MNVYMFEEWLFIVYLLIKWRHVLFVPIYIIFLIYALKSL